MINIIELFEAIPTWMKWTGCSFVVVLLFLLIVASQPGGEEAIKAPATVKAATDDASRQLVSEGAKASTSVAGEIISSFDKTGEEMAKQVPDKAIGAQIHFLGILAGVLLAGAVVVMIMAPIIKVVGSLSRLFG